jgi:deferrochelatase/peroxidase EfeB
MTKTRGGGGTSRRFILTGAAGLLAAAAPARAADQSTAAPSPNGAEPFFGTSQAGIATPAQSHTFFAAFDLHTNDVGDVTGLLQTWTDAAARLTAGQTAQPIADGLKPADAKGVPPADRYDTPIPLDPADMTGDTGEALGLPLARLTLTFGFGPGLFTRDGADRFGLAARRPEAFVDLPRFAGDQLDAARTGGDLSVQACADDPQVAFHAVRQLARLTGGVARILWAQSGFLPAHAPDETPRNLMGFKDGTRNISAVDTTVMDSHVWVGAEGPDWMHGGSYLVARRIRIALEHWDRMKLMFQEQTVGRQKLSGAPLGREHEKDPLDLDREGEDGNPLIAENAHVRLAAPEENGGSQILRRPYSFNDGVNFTTERWPPWRQGLEYDAGLFFLAYQRDVRTGFIRIFDRMSKFDMLNQFVTHVGGGLFACPGGVARGEFVGQRLFKV